MAVATAMVLLPQAAWTQNQDSVKHSIAPPAANALRAQAQSLIDAGKPEEALALVAAQESNNSNDPEFDYLLGTTALAAGSNAVAVHALERAVLVQPDFAGAWLDLAIAHFRLGEIEVADGILLHIENNFNPPQDLRAEIAEVRRKIFRARRTSGWQADFGAFAGQTSNANYGLSVSSLQLNLSGMPVSLTLDPSYSPRSDAFTELRGTTTGRINHAHNTYTDIYASLRYRGHDTESSHDQRDAILSGMWHRPVDWPLIPGAIFLAGGSARNLAYPGQQVTIGQLSSGLRIPVRTCQITGRVDLEQRLFSGDSAYNASIPWLGLSSECTESQFQYGGQQRFGLDSPTNTRPGGAALRAETIAFGRWYPMPSLQLGAMLIYAYSRDAQAYSPLLANGDRRWIHRLGQKLEAVWVPGTNARSPWAIVIEYENIHDQSNIGLSNMKINQFQIGLVYRYF